MESWKAAIYPTLSAAEAELTEATEALVMGDSFDALVSDIYHGYPKTVLVDNMAAINLLAEESGVWRTRHLRLRAHNLRWRITRLDWRVAHCPGAVMIADIGTKPLSAVRLRDLKRLMGMTVEEDTDVSNQLVTGGGMQSQAGFAVQEKVLRMILMASLIQAGQAQPGDDQEELRPRRLEPVGEDGFLTVMVLVYTAVIILATLVFERFWRSMSRWRGRSTTEPPEVSEFDQRREEEYARVRSQIRQADRARRAAADRLLELQMRDEEEREIQVSRRRSQMRTQRFDVFTRADRPRTPSLRQSREGSVRREEVDQLTEAYTSPSHPEGDLPEGDQEDDVLLPEQQMDENLLADIYAGNPGGHAFGKGVSKGGSRASADVPTSGASHQDLRRHQEIRELEQYSRSVQEENYEELRRQHLQASRGLLRGEAEDPSEETERATSAEEPMLEDELEQRQSPLGSAEDPVPEEVTTEDVEIHGVDEEERGEEMSIAEGGEEEQLEHDPSATEGNPSARGNSASPAEPDQEPEDEQQNPDPNQSPVGPYVPEYRCMITGGGNCYHTSLNCCTLHNTRTLRRSVWCPSCSLITDNERYGAAYTYNALERMPIETRTAQLWRVSLPHHIAIVNAVGGFLSGGLHPTVMHMVRRMKKRRVEG